MKFGLSFGSAEEHTPEPSAHVLNAALAQRTRLFGKNNWRNMPDKRDVVSPRLTGYSEIEVIWNRVLDLDEVNSAGFEGLHVSSRCSLMGATTVPSGDEYLPWPSRTSMPLGGFSLVLAPIEVM